MHTVDRKGEKLRSVSFKNGDTITVEESQVFNKKNNIMNMTEPCIISLTLNAGFHYIYPKRSNNTFRGYVRSLLKHYYMILIKTFRRLC